jgi:aryl-alcohol dehydrogenase-like predicted oxidoreductase
MALQKRQLGKSGLEITTVGFGSWAVGGGGWSFGWGPQDDEESIAAIRHAVSLGVNWVDTAAIYGLGHSEEVVGRAIQGIPATDRPLIFTKCGLIADRAKPFEVAQRNLRPESIRRECEDSLRRLGVDRIDLYQFHWADETGTPIEDSWGEMSRLVQEGKIRAAGVSNFTVALLERCEKVRHVDSLQPPFSLIRRDSGAELIPWCAEHGTGVIVYSPMQAGLLTDTFDAARVAKLAEDDWRRRTKEFQEPNLSRNLALRDALRPIAARHNASIAATAVAWTLHWPGVTGAIVGARAPKQVEGWVRAGDVALTPQDLEEVAQAVERTGAGTGPLRSSGVRAAAN